MTRRIVMSAGFLVALAAAAIWVGSMRSGTAAVFLTFPSAATQRSVETGGDRFRIATFNIHSGVGTDGRLDLDRTAESLQGFDLIGLMEVRGRAMDRSMNQADDLAGRLKMDGYFTPSERRWFRDDFGNGVLARQWPLTLFRMPLPATQHRGFRNVVLLQTMLGGKMTNVLITHIDRETDHDQQLNCVETLFENLAEPAVLIGDLNTTADNAVIRRIQARHDVNDARAMPSVSAPADCVDWIFSRGVKILNAGLIDHGASDHPVLWAELQQAHDGPHE